MGETIINIHNLQNFMLLYAMSGDLDKLTSIVEDVTPEMAKQIDSSIIKKSFGCVVYNYADNPERADRLIDIFLKHMGSVLYPDLLHDNLFLAYNTKNEGPRFEAEKPAGQHDPASA